MRAGVLLIAAAVTSASVARAQSPLHRVAGGPSARLGWAVAGLGDVNQDGIAEYVAGAPFDSSGGVQAGRAYVIDGASGARLHTLGGSAPLDHLGWSVAGLADINQDGVPDVAVGAPDSDFAATDAGLVRWYSGANGTFLRNSPGFAPGQALGYSLANAGDVNDDGVDDVIAGAPFDPTQGQDAGSAVVFSGLDGSVLHVFHGDQAGDRLGVSVAAAGDLDQDDYDDLLIGADQASGSGAGFVRVLSGRNGAVLYERTGSSVGDRFGAAVAGGRDLDGDLLPEFLVGAPGASIAAPAGGGATLFRGASAQLWASFGAEAGGEELGHSVSFVEDLDGDGLAEIAASALFPAALASGAVRIWGGVSHLPLWELPGESGGDRFGWSIAPTGDLDGDGRDDWIVGAPKEDAGGNDSGAAIAFGAGRCAPTSYCTAKTNSLGCLPQLDWSGTPGLSGADDFVVHATQVLNNKLGVLFWSRAPDAVVFQGGMLCLADLPGHAAPQVSGGNPPPNDCSGRFDFALTQANLTALGFEPGHRLYVQVWSRDRHVADGSGMSLSDALEITVCR